MSANLKSAQASSLSVKLCSILKFLSVVVLLLTTALPSVAIEPVSAACDTITDAINGHEYVDLGLSVKWATCNVGANSPSDYGNYYAWGETTTKEIYTDENSKTYGKDLLDIAGNSEYDAARACWGETWRLPTKEEMEELWDKCTWTWTTQDDHNGFVVTGPSGNSIFLPAASGSFEGMSPDYIGVFGDYWCSTPYRGDALVRNFYNAYSLSFYDLSSNVAYCCRCLGQTIRPVSD